MTRLVGKSALTPHIVVRGAAAAAEWYGSVFGAEERGRLEVSGGKLMQLELWFGGAQIMLADVLLGVGGLFGADWERREIDKYLRRRGGERR